MQQDRMARDLRQEEVRGNAVKALGILPREVREEQDQAVVEAEAKAKAKIEVAVEARVRAEAPARAVVTVNFIDLTDKMDGFIKMISNFLLNRPHKSC
jgi:undecaprenyl pyrophosphate synthase